MATQTITTDAPQALELAAAMGAKLGLGRSATAPEVKTATVDWYRSIVKDYRRLKLQADNQAAIDAAFDPI